MRTACLSLVYLLLPWSLGLAEDQPKPDPREKLETAIPEGIRLLEAKEYTTFIKTFAHPEELKKITENVPLEQLIEDFGKDNGPKLLKVLQSIKDKQPTLSEDGNAASFALEAGLAPRDKIVFVKVDQFWYIKN